MKFIIINIIIINILLNIYICNGEKSLIDADEQKEYQVQMDHSHFMNGWEKPFKEFSNYLQNLPNVKIRDFGYHIQREIVVLDTKNLDLNKLGFKLRLRREPGDDWEVTLKFDGKSKNDVLKSKKLLTPAQEWLEVSEDDDEDDPTYTSKIEEDINSSTSKKWSYSVNIKPSDSLTSTLSDIKHFNIIKLKKLFPNLVNKLNLSDDTSLIFAKYQLRESQRKIKLRIKGVKCKSIYFVAYKYDGKNKLDVDKVEFSWKLKNYKKKQWKKSTFEFSNKLHQWILDSKWTKPMSTHDDL